MRATYHVEGKHAKQSGGRGQYGHSCDRHVPAQPGSNPKATSSSTTSKVV
ncbi:hypothetical protein ACNKHO_21035 [Shigella flexneri]